MKNHNNKIRILQNGLPGGPDTDNFLNENENVVLDQRDISSYSIGSAGSFLEYDIIILNLPITMSIPVHRITELKKFLNDKLGIFIYVLYPKDYDHSGGEVVTNYDILEELIKELNETDDSIQVESRVSYILKTTDYGKNSAFKNYLEDDTVQASVLISPMKELMPLSVNVEDEITAFTLTAFQNQVFAVPPIGGSFVFKLLEAAFSAYKQSGLKPTNAPDELSPIFRQSST